LSTGLDYISQCFASTEELVQACQPVGERGRLYVTHVRYKKGVLAGVREAVEIGRRSGASVHISHLKAATAEEAERLLEYIDHVAVHEVDFSFDVYPYLPGSTMLNALLPYEVWEDGPLAAICKLARADVRRRFAAALDEGVRNRLANIRLAWMPGRAGKKWIGRSLAEYVAASGRTAEDALCDLLLEQNLAVLCVFHLGDDRLVEPFLRHPRFLFGSDGIDQPEGHVHPRQFGAAARLLGPLVRDRRVLTLEEAVRRMTAAPAARFGLGPRGMLRPGAAADVVVFDPATIGDRATFDEPRMLSIGVDSVVVSGVPVWRGGAAMPLGGNRRPGRAIRYAPA
jgi:N-acyl-D-amino-acid deacylase